MRLKYCLGWLLHIFPLPLRSSAMFLVLVMLVSVVTPLRMVGVLVLGAGANYEKMWIKGALNWRVRMVVWCRLLVLSAVGVLMLDPLTGAVTDETFSRRVVSSCLMWVSWWLSKCRMLDSLMWWSLMRASFNWWVKRIRVGNAV